MNLKKVVGLNLKYYRYKSGMSQEKFYSNMGYNPKYLAAIERGKVNISIDYIEDLAIKLGVSAFDLVTFNENRLIRQRRIDEKIRN